jgi:predicted membrane metal-binding protein
MANKTWEGIVGTFCISLSATLASAPLSILYFGLLAPFAIALNMVLVPAASLVIISGLFSLISGFLHIPALAAFLNHGPLVLILITENLLEMAVRMPVVFVPLAWVWDGMGFLTVFLFLGSLLAGHALKLPKVWLFCFPVVLTLGMIFLNSLIRML